MTRRREHAARSAAPLRRKPKQLDEAPTVYEAKAGSGGSVLTAQRERHGAPARPTPASAAPGETDERGELVLVSELEAAEVDPVVRQRARQIAARLSVPRPRSDRTAHHGAGSLASVPYRGASDEIDLDRTIEVLAERPVPEDEDIIVRDRVLTTRSVVLAVDVSGSMKGERVQTAAATVGALAAELHRDAFGVIAFWSDAAVLLPVGAEVKPMELLDTMLRIPARGLTNVAFPLELAAGQLARVPAREARVVLLSDCVHNAGPDPRPFAARLPRLDVLLDTTGEKDLDLGRELALLGHGALRTVRSHRDVAPALSDLFREA